MKTMLIIWIATLSFAVMAQSTAVIENAPQNYEKALKSANPGVVKSAIFYAVKLKLYYPEQNTEKLNTLLERLSQGSESTEIRYKAYLASQFMSDGKLLEKIEKQDYKDGDQFFRLLADELQNEILAER